MQFSDWGNAPVVRWRSKECFVKCLANLKGKNKIKGNLANSIKNIDHRSLFDVAALAADSAFLHEKQQEMVRYLTAQEEVAKAFWTSTLDKVLRSLLAE